MITYLIHHILSLKCIFFQFGITKHQFNLKLSMKKDFIMLYFGRMVGLSNKLLMILSTMMKHLKNCTINFQNLKIFLDAYTFESLGKNKRRIFQYNKFNAILIHQNIFIPRLAHYQSFILGFRKTYISYQSNLKKQVMAIAQTKNDPNVGAFGLIPNSASYVVIGHEMQYEAIFIKIKSLTGTKWNHLMSSQQSTMPQDQIKLGANEFIMPIKQFINVFHLIYVTSNKFVTQESIFYNRYSLNLDARQSKAKMVVIQVQDPVNNYLPADKQTQYMTNVTIYFPSVRAYDLAKHRTQPESQQFLIPFCKLMIGMQSETNNLEASFVESMKQKMLQNDQTDFLCVKSNIQYQWKQGTYFKGYDNTCTFLMKLKPGKYYLRFKIQTLRVEYRSNINIVSSTQVKISDPKMDRKQEEQFLKEIISSKARLQKRNIGYFNPIKKGSWYICSDDFDSIGYGFIVIQTRKNSEYKIQVKVDPKKLRQAGYRLKDKKDQNKYSLTLQDGEGQTIILKQDDTHHVHKEHIWPPPGIEIIRLWRKQFQK